MTTLVIMPPPRIVSLDAARRQLHIDGTDQDVEIGDLIDAAQGTIDGPNGWLGRALGPQTLEWQGCGFDPCGGLPYRPVASVTSVSYVDPAGATQVLGSSAWFVEAGFYVRPASGWSSPTLASRQDAVRIRYEAGWPMSSDDADVWTGPAPIRHAVQMMVARLYANRGEAIVANLTEDPAIKALLAPWRVWSL